MTVNVNHIKPNFTTVTTNNTVIYFSYKTPVAFFDQKNGLVISENVWSPTTGRHLNIISKDKSIRISNDKFEKLLAKTK